MSHTSIQTAYDHCLDLARSHYENFPVASFLLPKHIRRHVAAVYAFARTADDYADEGTNAPDIRLRKLEAWRDKLRSAVTGETVSDPVFIALADTIRRFDIPPVLFHDLLDAFAQDVRQSEYASFDELLAYCSKSANPVGRIILALFGRLTEETAPLSDALCTGLQLANFWQDVSVDIAKPRLYLPLEDLTRFNLKPEDLSANNAASEVRKLIEFQVNRTRGYFDTSKPLLTLVPFRLSLELRAIRKGGMAILDEVQRLEYDVLHKRPVLSKPKFVRIFIGAFFSSTFSTLGYDR